MEFICSVVISKNSVKLAMTGETAPTLEVLLAVESVRRLIGSLDPGDLLEENFSHHCQITEFADKPAGK